MQPHSVLRSLAVLLAVDHLPEVAVEKTGLENADRVALFKLQLLAED